MDNILSKSVLQNDMIVQTGVSSALLDLNDGLPVGTEFEIMSFTVTLLDSAKNLGENDSCGNLCLSTALFNDTVVDKSSVGDGICYSPTVTITSSNPTTGNFMNYALLGGAALLTIGAISLVSRKNKFYHV